LREPGEHSALIPTAIQSNPNRQLIKTRTINERDSFAQDVIQPSATLCLINIIVVN